ncbi:type VII secretion protein EccC [Corynebacterium pseudotuberculosis]|uniref:Type VII secretion protein EccC n=1 Tax=Corynebacterium pseudotuberculosis (strain C231) TaxID=681645 RepID=D9QEH1_CORP2|nr:type VII secretion protein EccC [Corynebacterium pseudotuberculosis]ADL09894.1 type VII secretion protein EccC [Corynebacterium pseudotuberculosis C231]AEK91736.1 ESX-3 secretion system protein eccC3 [Corynebacterium pseudotuberculosis PAT10]AEP69666.1 ESX-3 secretion system protein eccC3 [Corynebacterium pseudotuberculosis 42/02-A]ARS59930.1 ESX-3 secretion system protein [Corynebacterium pseudotuberculosis]MEB3106904.1 type VII secretion protein EccC [Corynebacterium pseudotuberculosis]
MVGTNVSTIQKNDDAKLSEQQFLFKGESSCASATPQKNESNNKADRGIIPQLSEDERLPAPPLPTGSLKPEPVPEAARAQPVPLLKMLMPLAMVVAVIAMVGLLVISGGALNPMMLTLPLMMGMSLLMMFSPAPGEDTAEMRRTYLRHLVALREKAIENADAQRAHELYRHPLTCELWSIVGTEWMWERLGDASDALEVRIGTGSTALCTPFEISDSGATEDLDPVCAVSLRSMVQSLSSVHDMPLIIQLQAFRVINILGDAAPDLARAIAAQLCFYHGPEAVGIGLVARTETASVYPDAEESWAFIKWLPHHREPQNAQHKIFIVDCAGAKTSELDVLDIGSWDVIIAVNAHPSSDLGVWAEEEGIVLQADSNLGVITENGFESIGTPESLSNSGALLLARLLTRYKRAESENTASSDLRALLKLHSLEGQLDVGSLWEHWNTKSAKNRRLSIPFGLNASGKPVVLDIKESAHGGMGPHGLCLGSTGSGKSELLRTLVVGLAATHSPEDLNFVLVDFKGGATFLGLDQLPHTSAVITNLAQETVLVERMHDAISGEMNRRQEMLRQAGNFSNVSEYTAARQHRQELPPMPALLIIVDEFSELLGQHPDFADLFVAVGRLGRSLHIHLLLASQRLDEGRLRGLDSHLSYRIGLKTFSAAESRQILGVPDAHELPNQPGVGFLSTGAGELQRFRASYVSGPMQNLDAENNRSRTVRLWTGWEDPEPQSERTPQNIHAKGKTLVDAIVSASVHAAAQQQLRAHRIWLPPLPKTISLSSLAPNQAFLTASVGVIDRPYLQRQDSLIMNFLGQSGHAALCGGPQTGKSNALHTIMASLAIAHSTHDLRFYVLDLAGTSLAATVALPHVAGVAHRTEVEKVRRIVDEVVSFIDAPEERHTFLVIDGWHVVGQNFEDLLEPLARIASDGLSAHVHLLISTPRWTALRPEIRDLIPQRIELKLAESLDSLIDRKAQSKLPLAAGRGLNTDKEHILFAFSTPQDLEQAALASARRGDSVVPKLKMLPSLVCVSELTAGLEKQEIPFGIGGKNLSPLTWKFQHSSHLLCVGNQGCGKSTLMRAITTGIEAMGKEHARIVMIDHRRAHLGAIHEDMLAAYSATSQDTERLISDVIVTLRSRLPNSDVTAEQLKNRSWWCGPDIFLLIDDLDILPDGCLYPLLELLPHSKDIGLHVVVCRKLGGMQRALYQPFLAELRDQQPTVIILDGDRDEGPIFGVRPSQWPPGRGILVERGSNMGVFQIAVAGTCSTTQPDGPQEAGSARANGCGEEEHV